MLSIELSPSQLLRIARTHPDYRMHRLDDGLLGAVQICSVAVIVGWLRENVGTHWEQTVRTITLNGLDAPEISYEFHNDSDALLFKMMFYG